MEAFSAVVTTGIYCRPGCGAQPHAENVRKFSLAAAAEAAGYRACLRCRPYRVPQAMDWSAPELVCRAVSLILDGVLDEGTEAQLAGRLGVSERHLRRLFTTHLGVTPDGLARSARTHFARLLLDDSDFTITEIAHAAGFGSLRQFNRACQDVFRASPRELRAKRRKTDRLVADGGLALRLPFHGPLDWDAMVAYLAARAIPGVEHVSDGIYRRTIVVGSHPGVLELFPGGGDHLVLRAHLPHWEELIHVVDRVRRIANIDFDHDEPARQLAGDPIIGPLLRARPGVRAPGTWDPFETGVRAIVGQQVTIALANSLTGRLVERLGSPVGGLQLGLTHTFPSADAVAAADLTGLGLTSSTMDAIRAFARAVADDAIRLDRSVSLDRFVASISKIDGVGPWTAHDLAFRLGEPDAWPTSELSLQRAPAALAELARRWRPWRALAAAYLWMVDGWPEAVVGRVVPHERCRASRDQRDGVTSRSGRPVDDIKILTDLNERFIEAFRKGSWEVLRPILSPSFSYMDGATGQVWPMERYIADLEGNPLPSIEIDQVRVHVDGDTAVVSSRSFTSPGRYNRYIDTYERLDNGWLCVHACVWPLQ